MTTFIIDNEEINLEELGEEAMGFADRMRELQQDLDMLEVRKTEITALLNFYAMTIKSMANPDPKIEIVKK